MNHKSSEQTNITNAKESPSSKNPQRLLEEIGTYLQKQKRSNNEKSNENRLGGERDITGNLIEANFHLSELQKIQAARKNDNFVTKQMLDSMTNLENILIDLVEDARPKDLLRPNAPLS